MTTTFLVHRNAKGVPVAETRTLRTKADVSALSYYTMCAIADTLSNPFGMVASGDVLVVDLDAHGNFLRAECLGRALPKEQTHSATYPHEGGCAQCCEAKVCNGCGEGLGRDRCTNGRCPKCHASRCGAGGATSPGHGYI